MIPSRLGITWALLAGGCALALLVMVVGSFRQGGYVLAVVLIGAAIARVALPNKLLDGLIIRSRWLDTLIYLALAAAVLVIFAQVKLSSPV